MNTLKNKVQLLGNLGAIPEVRTTQNGNKMARLRIATNETYKNAQGEKVTDTQWHTAIAWGKTAEIAELYLNKGSEVMVEGRLQHREYTDKDGAKRTSTEVQVINLLLMDRKAA
jgi:single-strand DNA-binding protein